MTCFFLWLPSIFLCLHYWYRYAAAVSFQFCKIWGTLNDWRHICTNVSFPRSLRFSQSRLGVLWIPAHMWSGRSVYVSILSLLSFWTFPPVLSAGICCHMWTLIVFAQRGDEKREVSWKKGNERTVEVCLPWESKIKKEAIACDVSHEKGPPPFRLSSSRSDTFN